MPNEWGPDGELPDIDKPGKVDPRPEPAFPTQEVPDDTNQNNNNDGPSIEEIVNGINDFIDSFGPLLAAGAAAGFMAVGNARGNNNNNNNNNTSPTDTPTDNESPAPADKGKGTPAEPAPTKTTPVPGPVPQPGPKPATGPETGSPPKKCWVAREVYGYDNPSWLLFRDYLDFSAPTWFKKFYISHGEKIADFIKDKPFLKNLIRFWMDTKIEV